MIVWFCGRPLPCTFHNGNGRSAYTRPRHHKQRNLVRSCGPHRSCIGLFATPCKKEMLRPPRSRPHSLAFVCSAAAFLRCVQQPVGGACICLTQWSVQYSTVRYNTNRTKRHSRQTRQPVLALFFHAHRPLFLWSGRNSRRRCCGCTTCVCSTGRSSPSTGDELVDKSAFLWKTKPPPKMAQYSYRRDLLQQPLSCGRRLLAHDVWAQASEFLLSHLAVVRVFLHLSLQSPWAGIVSLLLAMQYNALEVAPVSGIAR